MNKLFTKKGLVLLFILMFAMIALAGCGGAATEDNAAGDEAADTYVMPEKIVIGASEPGSSWYPVAAAMKDVIEKAYPGTRVDIFYGGGDVNLQALETGDIDFGITFSVNAADSVNGHGRFAESGALTNVSGAMGLWTAVLHMVTSPNSGINSVEDLKGKTISTGMQFYATTSIFNTILDLYGMTLNDMGKVEYATAPDMGTMFKDKALDFFAVHSTTLAPYPTIEDISVQTDIKILGLPDDILDQLHEINPGHVKAVIPANLYKGQTEDIVTEGTTAVLACRKDLDEQLVYNVVSTLVNNAGVLAQSVPDLVYITKEQSPVGLGIDLHPGAATFYEE